MWMLWAVLGCGADQRIGRTDVEDLVLEVDPPEIDFGVVALGESAEESLTLRNNGASDVLVAELRTSGTDLALIGVGTLQVPGGGEEELTIQWTPSSPDALAGSFDMKVGTLGDLSDLEVPAVGTVTGVELTISEQRADLGEVSVGCSETLSIDAWNTGTAELVIQSLELTNDLDFTLEDGQGGTLVLPIEIAPGLSAVIDVVYTPTSANRASTTLQIASNDPLAPTQSVSVDAQGVSDQASNTMFWTVEGHTAVTAIIQVNDFLLWDDEHFASSVAFVDRVLAFFPALFEGLRDAGVSYRLAIVVNEEGEVAGDVPYIDDSFTVEEADAAAQAMLDTMSISGDNDQGLETCLNAIEANESWVLADGGVWHDSQLNLLVINNDAEQSPGDFTHYVKLFSEYKDPEDFAVHGIAGKPPYGCGDGGSDGHAAPSNNLFDTVEATGGVFLSICDADWTKSVPAFVEGLAGGVVNFVLEGNPAPESIDVRIDGIQIFSGWSYGEKTREIRFDDASYPPRGSELRVDYLMAVICE